MLRLVRRCSQPLRGLYRGFAAVPAPAPIGAAEEREKQLVYYDRINRKMPRQAVVSQEAFDRTTRFLMDRGFSQLQALKALSLHVALANYTIEMMESKIKWLNDLGLSHDKINDMIKRHPNILGVGFDKYEALIDWYISNGVPEEKIAYVFNVFPHGVSHSFSSSLDPKVDFLKEIGCSEKQIRSVLMMAPQMFTHSVESMRAKADFLVELETVDALDEMFGAGAGVRALIRNCPIVMCNIDNMRESFDYLISIGFTKERLEKNTKFITRSVDRFIRPRFQFLTENDHNVTKSLAWILMPEVLFIDKYPDYEAYVAEYKAKRKQIDSA
ncbi:hypothetical protein PF001_g21781 [Phytophthora fragariae]|uniref:Uncharacterized protein n=1 Tax=Phytophthora fragariae TaxID=53985 RepID=A0A6A4CF59_9STRA|nr:hypothetical protein PF001_g21781 [Phytophthora fragariae]